jgi:hypothetical protein
MRRLLLFLLCFFLYSSSALAQHQHNPYTVTVDVPSVSLVFARLFGPDGLTVDSQADLGDGQVHTAHFNSAFQSELAQFSTAIARKLVSLPLPSPASSIVYEYNTQGDLVPSPKSFGPILAERTETMGPRRTSVGFAFQRFSFSNVEGLSMDAVPAVFQHDGPENTGGRADVVSTMNAIEVVLNQFTTFVTYGLSDRVDISVAIPMVTTSIAVRSEATIERLGSTNPAVHFYRQTDGSFGDSRLFTSSGSASGLGDITVRAKSQVTRWRTSALGVGLDLRIPTGDERNLLGAGAAGLKPFAIWSGIYGSVSPHANVGYLWNGSSTLAGSPLTGNSQSLPDQVSSAIGIDVRLSGRITTAFDVLGDRVMNSPRLIPETFTRNGVVLPNITFTRSSFTEWNGAAGMKVLLTPGLLLNANLLFKLNDTGLRSRVTALVGLGVSL